MENRIHPEYIGKMFHYRRGKNTTVIATVVDIHVTHSHVTGDVVGVEYCITSGFLGQKIHATVPLSTIKRAMPFID